ncbi:MAG TPA: PQQ-dependent dehydrogenase, methanol/ethanol family [Longimicrobiaceae bacterium]|nr:PQQ-dependent dehydrogenase, methanol/ethanol family [Longimicrobiaceae bacterium]
MRPVVALALLAALAGCAKRAPVYPLTQQAVPFSDLNAEKVGRAPPVAQRVTSERLVRARAEPQNWLTYYGAYDGQRYSPLDQVDTRNVRELRPAWTFHYEQLGLYPAPLTAAFEAAPLVVDGVMYVSGPNGYVWALDAATGRLLWQYEYTLPIDVPLCCGNVNRGVAVANGKVFYASANAHLVALDAATGAVVWERVFGDVRAGESATAAPLVVKDRVIVGSSGAEYGVRGHLDAFDVETGAHAWRLYTVPKPGEPGSESWPANRAWERGGGATWITGTYDPELDLLYWGTANPAPVFNGMERAGSNLYTSGVVAIDPDDGRIRWHYQWTPHDVWDYDGVGESILYEEDGRRLIAHADRNGYFFVLDRTDGSFVRAAPFARVDWARIDPRTGAVTERKEPTREGTRICPGPAGAKVWNHASYSRQTGLVYVPVIELCATFTMSDDPFAEGMPYFGSTFNNYDEPGWGHVKAIDPRTGREAWSWRGPQPMVASMLSTAGGLVFTGDPLGRVLAFNARTGELLWQYETGSGIHSSPVTYSVGGRQYVAVPVGWGGWLEGFAPKNYGAPRATALHVFALP